MGILSILSDAAKARNTTQTAADAAKMTVKANQSKITSTAIGGQSQTRHVTDAADADRREFLRRSGDHVANAAGKKFIAEQSGRGTGKVLAPGVLASKENLASFIIVQEFFALLHEDIKGIHEYAIAFAQMLYRDLQRLTATSTGDGQ